MPKKYLTLALVYCLPFLAQTQSRTDSLLYLIGNKLDSTLAVGSPDYFLETFDQVYLIEEIPMVKYNTAYKKHNFIGIMAEIIIEEIRENGGSYDFIDYREDLAGYYLMFRMYSEIGINYQQYFLFENEDGELKIGNVFSVLLGSNFSELLEQSYFRNEVEKEKSGASLFNTAINFIDEGELENARTVFKTIPEEIRNQKKFLILEIKTLEDTVQLNDWLKRFENAFPENPAPYLLSIEPYLELNAYSGALAVVDSLDNFVDDDFLDFFRGQIFHQKNDFDKAIYYYEKLMENYPFFVDGLSIHLLACLQAEKYEKTIPILDNLLLTGFTKKDVKSYVKEDYPKFYKSQIFKQWLKK